MDPKPDALTRLNLLDFNLVPRGDQLLVILSLPLMLSAGIPMVPCDTSCKPTPILQSESRSINQSIFLEIKSN